MYVSQLLGKKLRDSGGRPVGRIRDLLAQVHGSAAPYLTGLVFRHQRALYRIALLHVRHLDAPTPIVALEHAGQYRPEAESETLHLKDDILDRQLIDLEERRMVRVNDVVLAASSDVWRVVGVDHSLRALMRRLLPRGLRWSATDQAMLPW